ncbi:MAG: hypothetical protein H0W70_07370 [Actinobacteria bacterium]|nr:hypothetical protein [Actinomycetota bacterium]
MKRVGLVILALSSGPIGLWATLAPRSFYDDFPGMGRHWVQLDGPYNHHLVTDFGSLNLAMTALAIGALLWTTRRLIQITAVAYLIGALPHELYHATHLDPFETSDKVGQLVGLAVVIVVALALLVATVTEDTRIGRANSS